VHWYRNVFSHVPSIKVDLLRFPRGALAPGAAALPVAHSTIVNVNWIDARSV
jgi:hypothetical protein